MDSQLAPESVRSHTRQRLTLTIILVAMVSVVVASALLPRRKVYGPVGLPKSLGDLVDAAPHTDMGTTVVGLACSGGGSR